MSGSKPDIYKNVLGTFGDDRLNDNGNSLLKVCLR